jgi:hypothetical protein
MIIVLPPIPSWRQSRAYLRGAAAEPGKALCDFCVIAAENAAVHHLISEPLKASTGKSGTKEHLLRRPGDV